VSLETIISLITVAYSIVALALFSFARRARDPAIVATSVIASLITMVASFLDRSPGGLIGFFSSIILIFSLLSSVFERVGRRAFHSMLSFYFVSFSILLMSTNDSFKVFLYLEIISMLTIGGMALYRGREGFEAGLKYAIICLTGSLIGLLGLLIGFSEAGVSSFPDIVLKASNTARMLMAIGFGAEVALFPMYIWLPGLYVSMPPLLLAVEVSSILPATTYIVGTIASGSPLASLSLSTLAMAGSLIGSLAAMNQRDLRMLLAYSTLSHTGYIVLGLSSGSKIAWSYAVLHMVAHALPKASLIMVGLAALNRVGSSMIGDISKLGGVFKFVTISSALALLGLPPYLSFWSEMFIFAGLITSSIYWRFLGVLYFLVILVSTGYSFKLIYAFSQGARSTPLTPGRDFYGALLLLYSLLPIALSPLQSNILAYFLG
jgi:formate hydrogenlyase subunit 3/multisubunit Na+/H+ antiporter MnhD subunit